MSRISVLDCTLRDGGYVNDWDFGKEPIRTIISNLIDAGVDLIECGFITSKKHTSDSKSLFGSFDEADRRLRELVPYCKNLVMMINFGEYDSNDIPDRAGSCIGGIRVAFHKPDMPEAFVLCEDIKRKGYSVFVQPMNTKNYNQDELLELIERTNALKPEAIYIVDSAGSMRGMDVEELYGYYNGHLDEDITVGFHSHNNLQLSFSNAQEFIRCSGERQIAIDSTLMGIGRGAGNLCTELLAQHLNENNDGKYDMLPILVTIDEVLYPLQSKYQWGYTIPYYLAATCGCHPNYATYLSNKQTLKVKDISAMLKSIPDSSKSMYDQKMMEMIYIDFQNNVIDDSAAVELISGLIDDRPVFVIAPGRSYKDHLSKIRRCADSRNSLVVTVNFIDPVLNADLAFFGNNRRYSEYSESIAKFGGKVIVTSNIKDRRKSDLVINYADYLNDDTNIMDNSGLMLMNLLSKIGTAEIHLAGFDGFGTDRRLNYYDGLRNISDRSFLSAQNKSISTRIKQLSVKTGISFITPSMYENAGDNDF